MGSSYNFNWSFAHAKNLCKIGAEIVDLEEKANRVEICEDLQGRLQNEPNFLDKVITGESWVLDYDPETKRQSSEWHTKSSPRPKKARMSSLVTNSIFLGSKLVCGDDSAFLHNEVWITAAALAGCRHTFVEIPGRFWSQMLNQYVFPFLAPPLLSCGPTNQKIR